MIKHLKGLEINSIYDFDNAFSINELLCKFWEKIEETINISNECIEIINWVKEQALPDEVQAFISQLVADGTIEQMINVNKIEELRTLITNKITDVNEQLDKKIDDVNEQLDKKIDDVSSQLDSIAKYDVVVGLGCDNTGAVEIGDTIQSFLDNTNETKINLYFPPGTYKWNITVTTNKTLCVTGERGNVIINNSGDVACLKHSGDCTISGLIFNTTSSSRYEFTVYSNNGGEFLCYDTIFTCSSGKINGLHIENTIISHIDR